MDLSILLFSAILLLWLQLFLSLIPTWRFGEYYSYGWFVPPIGAAFALRRWQIAKDTPGFTVPRQEGFAIPAFCAVISGILLIAPLRIIVLADAGWRPPILLHALIVITLTHFLLWNAYGLRLSLWFLPVTIFSFSAVPYLWTFEQNLVRKLTGTVIGLAREIFIIDGRPVDRLGERLILGNNAVDVTEGCSGIRSLQSLIMAGLFFGELLFLTISRRLLLLLIAMICAIAFNTARAWWLAEIHFTRGKETAESMHDILGHLAFIASAALLYLSAYLLQNMKRHAKIAIKRSRVAAA